MVSGTREGPLSRYAMVKPLPARPRDMVGRPMEILLVEDDLEDAGLAIETLRSGAVPCRVSLVRDGEEALDFLHHRGHFARVPRPDLILLDLQLPKVNGREILQHLRTDAQLSRLPVVVMTASATHRAILAEEKLEVNDFLLKPFDRQQFCDVVKSLRRFLLVDVILPT